MQQIQKYAHIYTRHAFRLSMCGYMAHVWSPSQLIKKLAVAAGLASMMAELGEKN